MSVQPPVIQLDRLLADGDISMLAKHFGCSRKTIYTHLRHNNPKRHRGVPHNEVRMLACNLVRANLLKIQAKAKEIENALPELV